MTLIFALALAKVIAGSCQGAWNGECAHRRSRGTSDGYHCTGHCWALFTACPPPCLSLIHLLFDLLKVAGNSGSSLCFHPGILLWSLITLKEHYDSFGAAALGGWKQGQESDGERVQVGRAQRARIWRMLCSLRMRKECQPLHWCLSWTRGTGKLPQHLQNLRGT